MPCRAAIVCCWIPDSLALQVIGRDMCDSALPVSSGTRTIRNSCASPTEAMYHTKRAGRNRVHRLARNDAVLTAWREHRSASRSSVSTGKRLSTRATRRSVTQRISSSCGLDDMLRRIVCARRADPRPFRKGTRFTAPSTPSGISRTRKESLPSRLRAPGRARRRASAHHRSGLRTAAGDSTYVLSNQQ